ncbi:MAG: beta-galactosidase [Phycisphaerae bacterium]|nr:beta-galactosidase [Phycisphaerae bacterium]
MATVTYNDRSFLIHDERIWLVSGEIDYFRVPAALWADRLIKAKRAGLNCISTRVAWNFHEPEEGRWDFEGQKDVSHFVGLAEELGLYVILRPGPYIGADWDFGGLPAWLTGKSGVSYRTNNAAFTHYFDKYFAQILPRLVDQQVTQGGNIILIQNENEYPVTAMPDRTAYLDFINQLIRRGGFTIPIIDSNVVRDPSTGMSVLTDPPVEGNIECINAWDAVVPSLKSKRMRQPSAPMLVTEFQLGAADVWGRATAYRDGREIARKALEILGCGAQLNYSPFHGGSNVGFYAGRRGDAPDAFLTTSYDAGAPISESGCLTEAYYYTRLVNVLVHSMGSYFATSHEDEPGAGIENASEVMNLAGPLSRWAIVTNNGRSELRSIDLRLPAGHKITVSLEPLDAAAICFDLRLPGGQELDYCTLMPLGLFGREDKRLFIVHGPAGTVGEISIDGKTKTLPIPKEETPLLLEHQGLAICVVNTDLAMRTWPTEHAILFGPAFVGEDVETPRHPKGQKQYYVYLPEEKKLQTKKVKPVASARPAPPRLRTWNRVCICPEPVSPDLAWQKLDRPKEMDKLGIHYGYAWYRVVLEEVRARKRNLYFPECEDRASVYLNGSLVGVWGAGPDATRKPMHVDVKKGKNSLVLLLDNLGRFSETDRLGESKGLFGHVYDARGLRTNKFKLAECESYPKRIVPRTLSHLTPLLDALPLWSAELVIPLTKVLPIEMTFGNLPHHMAVFCNDRPMEFFARPDGMNWGKVTFGADLKKGKNLIRLLLWGDVDPRCMENVKFHLLEEPISAGGAWSYRPWTLPKDSAGEPVKGKSSWFAAQFKYSPVELPLFLSLSGAKKGQLFLNEHNLGRYWSVGPKEYYYLPESWLQEENTLLLFEEHGLAPTRCKLEFQPSGVFGV